MTIPTNGLSIDDRIMGEIVAAGDGQPETPTPDDLNLVCALYAHRVLFVDTNRWKGAD